jgi:trans-aconitate methyltransferase
MENILHGFTNKLNSIISNRSISLIMKRRDDDGWDAETYDNVSTPQEDFALKLVQLRNWAGNEIVMDAGCGSGRVTKILAKRIPNGRIYAVDNDVNMIDKAKDNLSELENIAVINSNLLDLSLKIIPSKVDVIFSNAVLHWVLDHPKIFSRFFDILNHNGQLLIQCGGYGNLRKAVSVFDKVKDSENFRHHFKDWKDKWYFPKPSETEKLLEEIGYSNVKVYLKETPISFPDRNIYSLYLKTVILGPYLRHIKSENGKEEYLENVLEDIEQNHSEMMWNFDYVRLNILADKIM